MIDMFEILARLYNKHKESIRIRRLVIDQAELFATP